MTSFHLFVAEIRPCVGFSDAPEILANHLVPTGLDYPAELYICSLSCFDWIYPTYNKGVGILSHGGPYYFSSLQKVTFLLCQYFFLLFIDVTRSWVSWMVMSAVWISDFLWAILLRMVWVLFAAFYICLSSSASFPVVSIFLTFKAPHRCWDIHIQLSQDNIRFLLPLGIWHWLNVRM